MTVEDGRRWVAEHPGTVWEPEMPRPVDLGAREAWLAQNKYEKDCSVGLGPLVRSTIVGCYRQDGKIPETARLMFTDKATGELRMPKEIVEAAKVARAKFLRDGVL